MYKIYTKNNTADSITVSRKLANTGKRTQAGPSDILVGMKWILLRVRAKIFYLCKFNSEVPDLHSSLTLWSGGKLTTGISGYDEDRIPESTYTSLQVFPLLLVVYKLWPINDRPRP